MASFSPATMIAASAVVLNGARIGVGGGGDYEPEPRKPDYVFWCVMASIAFIAIFAVVSVLALNVQSKHVVTFELIRTYEKKHKAGKKTHFVIRTSDSRLRSTYDEYIDVRACPLAVPGARRNLWVTENAHPWYGTNYLLSGLSAFCLPDNTVKK